MGAHRRRLNLWFEPWTGPLYNEATMKLSPDNNRGRQGNWKLALMAIIAPTLAFGQASSTTSPALVKRVSDTAFLEVRADSFKSLSPREQSLAYWLTQASIAIDPIIYEQLSTYGVRQKRLLEEILARPARIEPKTLARITTFAELFWANRGNHNENTSAKFLPEFTFEEFKQAALTAQANGALKTAYADLPPLADPAALVKELEALKASLFDPEFEPMTTSKSPKGGKDILQASANSFYPGLSLADLKDFKEEHPLNSTVVKDAQGKLHEEIWRAGTPDGKIAPGIYATYLKRANECLAKAREFADPAQAAVIADLIRFYQTGEYQDWIKFGEDWVRNDATVDFANGFIEVYRDARNAKGSSQSFVTITDKVVTEAMTKLAARAEYFESKAPWAEQYKKKSFKAPVVKAVETLIETGDFHVITLGDNLPNENEVHEKYGTKNFLFTGSSRAIDSASGTTALKEFAASPEEIARNQKYGTLAADMLVAMHEVIGHGSGKLSERMKHGSEAELKEYYSTLEEARADLMALWNVWDPLLVQLGLIHDQEETAKTMYDSQVRGVLMQLRRIPKGDTIEEDHQRDRQMIVQYIKEKTGSIESLERDSKVFYRVTDYQKMRQGVGMLLAELMRIKAEGDYPAIKALVDKYGVHFDTKLRDQVLERYRKLQLPTFWAGINSELTVNYGPEMQVEDVQVHYPRDPVRQYLLYGAMYDVGLRQAIPRMPK